MRWLGSGSQEKEHEDDSHRDQKNVAEVHRLPPFFG
jgi:hypothetical protein